MQKYKHKDIDETKNMGVSTIIKLGDVLQHQS